MSVKPKKTNNKKDKPPKKGRPKKIPKKNKRKKVKKETKKQIKEAVDNIPELIAEEIVKKEKKTIKTKKQDTLQDLFKSTDQESKKRKNIMWISVITLSAFIFFMWTWSLGGLIGDVKNKPLTEGTPLNAIKENFQESMEIAKQLENSDNSLQKALKETNQEEQKSQDDNDQVKEELKKLLGGLISSSTAHTSSSTEKTVEQIN